MSNPISRAFAAFARLLQAGVDRVEDPTDALERAYEQQLRALEETRRGRLEVETAAARLDLEARRGADAAARYEGQARRALAAGRDEVARTALARREDLLAAADRTASERARLDDERATLHQQEASVAAAVRALRSRKELLRAQYGAARARIRVGEALTGYSRTVTDVGVEVIRFEERLTTLQARAEALGRIALPHALLVDDDPLIEPSLVGADAHERVEREMDRLRRQIAPADRSALGESA